MAEPAASRLLLPRPALRAIREHAEAGWPLEACGLLEGCAIGRSARVRRVIPCRNEHERPSQRYRIDPEVFLRADREAGGRGRTIVGAWHTHPHGEVYFSGTDATEAWPGWHYLVVGVRERRMTGLGCWRTRDDGAAEAAVVVIGQAASRPGAGPPVY